MTDRSLPQFVDDDYQVRAKPVQDEKLTFWRTLDKPLLVLISLMLAMGLMMVYSSTFDWSLDEFGSETAILMSHVRNVIIGLVAMVIFARVPSRFIRRMSIVIMLMSISFLIAVLLFGDRTFGARRALINGRFQPGEFAELAMIIYMAAWLGSKNVRVRSITYGFVPFIVLVAIVTGLVILQPDLSTAVVIFATSGMMFFLAGADMRQIGLVALILLILGLFSFPILQKIAPYSTDRIDGWVAGISDPTQANYHIQQAIIAIQYGGWTGLGLGEGHQKFGSLPASHTDSIFAVIGEELGVVGSGVLIVFYMVFVIRGFYIARQADNVFSSLLASGVTIWVITKAMLNIAVMTGLIPPTGLPLPFISYGGSSLVVLMVGVGMLLGIQRETALKEPERRKQLASYDRSRGNRRARVSRTGSSTSSDQAVS